MGYVCCESSGALRQMLWNHAAGDQGLDGFSVVARHRQDAAGKQPELVIVWNGETVLPLD
jgi:hypothetical protein